jgi:WD40 repeat protein
MKSDPLERIVTVEFSPDGQDVVAAGLDGSVWLHKANGDTLKLDGHRAAISTVAFSPDGRVFLTTSLDGTARLWDRGGARSLAVVSHVGSEPVSGGAFAPDGRTFVLTGRGGRTWRTFAQPGALPLGPVHVGDVEGNSAESALALSPDGQSVAITTAGGARIFSAADGLLTATVRPTLGSGQTIRNVVSVDFHPTERLLLLASADEDGTAILWDLNTASPLAVLGTHRARLRLAKFSPDGRSIITASDDTTAAVWRVSETAVPDDSPFAYLLERATSAIPGNVTLEEITIGRRQN